jgi:hypothetical protein
MRDLDTNDSQLRLLAAVRRVCREHGGPGPSIGPVDELHDERGRVVGTQGFYIDTTPHEPE